MEPKRPMTKIIVYFFMKSIRELTDTIIKQKNGEMGGQCGRDGETKIAFTFLEGKYQEWCHSDDLGVGARIILK